MRVVIVIRGCEFVLDVEPKDSILETKEKIQHFLNVPVASQTLTFCGLEMIDGLDIEDYPITEGSKLVITIKCDNQEPSFDHHHQQRRKIQITIKFSSRKLNVEVELTETVGSLKEKIHIIDGTPIKRMSLMFAGKEMDDEFRYLSEYGICEFSQIIVFLKNMTKMIADPPSRKLSLVVQASSSLLNGACIPLEMNDLNTVMELRQFLLVARKILPVDEYIFIHKQRIMRDDCSLRWHGVENGDFLYVFRGSVSRGG